MTLKARYNNVRIKSFAKIAAKNDKKHSSAAKIIRENKLTEDSKSLIENLNEHVFARVNQPFSLALVMDESVFADNDVKLMLLQEQGQMINDNVI